MSVSWEIISHVGVGPVRFGMTRQEVRTALAAPAEEFRRTLGSRPADKFQSISAFAYYSDDGRLEAVEFGRLQQITIGDLNLTTTPFEQLLHAVLMLDPDVEIQAKSSGFVSRLLGAGAWTDDERSEPPQSVIAFAERYYD